jgi:hypothetical protein
LRTALAVAILACTVSVTAAARQPSSPPPHRRRAYHVHRVPKTEPAVAARTTQGILSGRNVILSEVGTSRSEVPTKSKDPYVPPISRTLAATTLASEPRSAPPPVAVYHEGSLALTAQNAPLGDILERVHESTGAVIEAPVLEERVSVQLGPQPPVQAIAALLEGMHLNYVILGGTSDQDCLQHIIITIRPKLAAGSQSAAPAPARGLEEVAAEARARALIRFTEQTGGEEGVWDNGPQSSPQVGATSSPARLPARE